MNAVAAAFLLFLFQEPVQDDIAARYPDPIPADRAWEMAADFYLRIGEAISRQDMESAYRSGLQMATRLPDAYRNHVAGVIGGVRGIRPVDWDRGSGLAYRIEKSLFLGFWNLGEVLGSPPLGPQPVSDTPRIAGLLRSAARIEAARGDYEKALDTVNEIERLRIGEWAKVAAGLRTDILELREGNEDPELLARYGSLLSHEPESRTVMFFLLKRLRDGPGAPGSPRRIQALKSMAVLLEAIGDHAGAKAVKDRILTEDTATQDDQAGIIFERVHVPMGAATLDLSPEQYEKAEEGCRRILREWPKAKIRFSVMEYLGDLLAYGKKPAEARRYYGEVLAEEGRLARERNEIIREGRIIRPDLHVKIGRTHEAEESWEKALESYQEGAKWAPSDFGGCGTCVAQKSLSSQTRQIRCLYRLGRDEIALRVPRRDLRKERGVIRRMFHGNLRDRDRLGHSIGKSKGTREGVDRRIIYP